MLFSGSPESVFKLVDGEGNEVQRAGGDTNLLLYKGGTVCDDYFDSNAADAICRDMGYANTSGRFNSGNNFDYQRDYDISLDNVQCGSDATIIALWSDCTFSETHNCGHSEDIFLACDVPTEPTSTPTDPATDPILEEGFLLQSLTKLVSFKII